ncbi:MAG: hypothetical protein ABI347_08305 [Nitrososphaera sp.]|jgi:hypothetical protein
MDAYLEEELYDLLTACIKDPQGAGTKRGRVLEIGRELYADGGTDSMENLFFAIEHRIKDETGADARQFRAWWNGIDAGWNY